jgi:hypothetical protein
MAPIRIEAARGSPAGRRSSPAETAESGVRSPWPSRAKAGGTAAAYQMSFESLADIPTAHLERVFRPNIFATFWLCQAAARVMKPAPRSSTRRRYRRTNRVIPFFTPRPAKAASPRSPRTSPRSSRRKVDHFGEQAPLYVLLASKESSYVTGMVYGATGGEITA